MVWGEINTKFRSQLVILNRTLPARRYVDEILQSILVPLMQQHMKKFQSENNAWATLTQNFLQTNDINIPDWSATHLWDKLGRQAPISESARTWKDIVERVAEHSPTDHLEFSINDTSPTRRYQG